MARCLLTFALAATLSDATPLEAVRALRMRGGAADRSAAQVQEKLSAQKQKLSAWWSSKAQGFGVAQNTPPDADRSKAAALMQKRGLSNVESAVRLLRAALDRDPDNVQLKLELADALNSVCRIKTNANSLVIEGTQDCPEFKTVWSSLGGEALPLATAARKAMPDSLKALAVYADAFLYQSSSQGIVKQALTGVGKKYISIAKELYKHPTLDSAVGCAFLGGFYNVAPWPVGSKSKAEKYLREGASIAPTRRNLYYAGVNAYQTGDFIKAKDYFSRAMKAALATSVSSTEADIWDFLLVEARRGLNLTEEALSMA